jgi:spermidine synthase
VLTSMTLKGKLQLQQKVAKLGGLVECRRIHHGRIPRHILASGGGASSVTRQLADAKHVRAIYVVGCIMSAVPCVI